MAGYTGLVSGIEMELLSIHCKDFHWLQDKMHKTIQPHSSVKDYTIVRAYQIINGDTWPHYLKRRKELYYELENERTVEKRLFHASPHAKDIGKKGFDLSFARSSGNFGAGVYFAEHSSKSNDYAFGLGQGCPTHKKGTCSTCERFILVCKVALGKEHVATSYGVKTLPSGFHTMHYNGRDPEYIIYDEKQAYPSYLVVYKANYK